MIIQKTCSLCSRLMAFGCRLMAIGLWLLAAGCSHTPKDATFIDEWPAIYPDYVEVTIPAGIAPLNFTMANDSIEWMDVEVKGSKEGSLHTNGELADFDIDAWHQLLAANRGGSLTVTVCAERDGQWLRYRDFSIYVSADTLPAWGITYRRIAPGYEMYGMMGLYQRCLANFDETAIIENTAIDGNCTNCHTSNAAKPGQHVFHVRGEHGATVVCRDGQSDILAARNDTLGGAMVYPSWHPGGRYIAFSTNKTSQMFHTGINKRIEVYDASSDVFVYDAQTRTILKDTLIMRKYWAENCPAFSADGQWLYFTTARRQVYPTDYNKERYSLCRVAFDAATGRIGSQVDTLVNTRLTGKSVGWARPSRDGRYILYVQADYGYFTIWHPESDLHLLDLTTGENRSLDEVNSQRAESFPAWAHDGGGLMVDSGGLMVDGGELKVDGGGLKVDGGRLKVEGRQWFLFTSRRDDGLYSRLYLAAIDSCGRATKPFMLPQRDPKRYYRLLMDSYNTPDFVASPVIATQGLEEQLMGSQRTSTRVVEL